MSSPPSNVGNIDLESVLNVRRRTLTAIGETGRAQVQYRYTDTIYLKREDSSNSLLSIDSKIVIFGELHFLCSIFERYTSNISIHEEATGSNKNSFSTTFEEDELSHDADTSMPAMISTLRQTSLSSNSSSPPQFNDSPPRRKKLNSIGRSSTVTSSASEYSMPNLEGKRYGRIQLPSMTIIEILEILLRSGLDLVDESSVYDENNVLHQSFVFSKTQSIGSRLGQPLYSNPSSFVGT